MAFLRGFVMLSLCFAVTHDSNLDILVAMRAGDINGDELAQDSFRYRRDHRIDIVETLVE